jgi:hypothetical protein
MARAINMYLLLGGSRNPVEARASRCLFTILFPSPLEGAACAALLMSLENPIIIVFVLPVSLVLLYRKVYDEFFESTFLQANHIKRVACVADAAFKRGGMTIFSQG